jgi:hypothetical protein
MLSINFSQFCFTELDTGDVEIGTWSRSGNLKLWSPRVGGFFLYSLYNDVTCFIYQMRRPLWLLTDVDGSVGLSASRPAIGGTGLAIACGLSTVEGVSLAVCERVVKQFYRAITMP